MTDLATILRGLRIIDTENGNGKMELYINNGSPESVIVGGLGAICVDTSNAIVYVKQSSSGSSGWRALAMQDFLQIKEACRLSTSPTSTGWTLGSANYDTSAKKLYFTGLEAGVNHGKIDGIEPVPGDRILIKNMDVLSSITTDSVTEATPKKYNGIWIVQPDWAGTATALVLVRSQDADTSAEVVSGIYTFVTEGTTNDNTGWMLATNNPITLNVTALTFQQFAGVGSYTGGNGIDISGSVISSKLKSTGGLEFSGSEAQINIDSTKNTTEVDPGTNELRVSGKARLIHVVSGTASNEVIDSVPLTDASVVEWFILVKNGTTGRRSEKLIALNKGDTTAPSMERISVREIGTALASFSLDVDINSGNMRLLLTTTTSGVTVEIERTILS